MYSVRSRTPPRAGPPARLPRDWKCDDLGCGHVVARARRASSIVTVRSDQDVIDELKREAGALLARYVRTWNGDDIASVLGTGRSRVADLRHSRLSRFSPEMLVRLLVRAGYDVELHTEARGLIARGTQRRP